MKRSIVYVALFPLLLGLGCKPKYDETTPRIAPVTEAVFASGIIEPKDAYTLTSMYDGYITKSYVTENDHVRNGQTLFQLDNRQQNTQVQIAENNREYARINAANNSPVLLQIKAQIEASKAKMQTDSISMSRYERLYTTHSVSKQDLDNARLNYKSSLSAWQANTENYRVTADKTKQELANTNAQLQNAIAGNQYYNLIATGESKIYEVFKKQGDLVRKGDKVAQLGNPDSIVITLNVDESSIGKVKVGQQALIELNTEKNKTYEAHISKIYPHFSETAQSYKVEAKFTEEMPGIISGTQVQANIITNRKDKALLIPHVYLIGDNKVLVKKDKNIDTVIVTTGINSYDWIEILSGLAAGDKIVKQK
jgi:multidrug efflux pump subunit AcrA (membrane-fusion protein)